MTLTESTHLAAYRVFHWIAGLPAEPFAGCRFHDGCDCERRCEVYDAALRGDTFTAPRAGLYEVKLTTP